MWSRDDRGKIQHCIGKTIEDYFVLVAGYVAVRKALKKAIQLKIKNLTIESDSQIVIESILGKFKAPIHILNLVSDIINLAQYFKIIQFNYCNTVVNRIT